MNHFPFVSVTKWQRKTFPKATAVSKTKHLAKEVQELQIAIQHYFCQPENRTVQNRNEINNELADCFILLCGIADEFGHNLQTISTAINRKFEILKLRDWNEPNEEGIYLHKENANEKDA